MLRIRMQRLGRRNRPFYRIAAMDQRTRRNGSVVEQLGLYDPLASDPSKQIVLNEERIKYWISVGAQPSETVRDFLANRALIEKGDWEKDRAWNREHVKKKAEAAAAAPAEEKKK
ncbi:MAG: 30S ribosomal protein S16 [Phycisphaerales bacterium]|nr:30S ribosomal protein S16 [Phycisphaerales bacterium]